MAEIEVPLPDLIAEAAQAVGGGVCSRRFFASLQRLESLIGIPARTLEHWFYGNQQPWPVKEARVRAALAALIAEANR